MKKFKKIIVIFFLFIFISNKVHSEIKDALFMTVGNKAIVKSDIVNEIKIILILNSESYSDSKKERLQKAAIKSIIRRSVKQTEIEKFEFYSYSQKDLQIELERLAGNINMDVSTLKDLCSSNDLNFKLIEDQIKTELQWNTLIFEIYKNELTINPDEIEEQLIKIQNEKKEIEYLISELLISIKEIENIDIFLDEINKKISNEGFEEVIKNLSIADSSLKNGDLGWLNEKIISKKIKPIIVNTPVGSISKPLIIDDKVLIFKVRDKRKIEIELTLEEKKDKIINYEKQKILNMHSLSHYDKVKRTIPINFINE